MGFPQNYGEMSAVGMKWGPAAPWGRQLGEKGLPRHGPRQSWVRVVSTLALGTSLGPCQNSGLCMGTAQGPWPGRRALWGPGDRPCCGIIGGRVWVIEGLTRGPGLWAGTAGPVGALRGGKQWQLRAASPVHSYYSWNKCELIRERRLYGKDTRKLWRMKVRRISMRKIAESE